MYMVDLACSGELESVAGGGASRLVPTRETGYEARGARVKVVGNGRQQC